MLYLDGAASWFLLAMEPRSAFIVNAAKPGEPVGSLSLCSFRKERFAELPGRCRPACFSCAWGACGCPEPLSYWSCPPALHSSVVLVLLVVMEWLGGLERLPGWCGGAPWEGWSR